MKQTTGSGKKLVTIAGYNNLQAKNPKMICKFLKSSIDGNLKNSDSKVWHGSPVWFLDGNPVVAYSVRKSGEVSLMFFSGQSFEEPDLKPEGKFKAAEIIYTEVEQVKISKLKRWFKKARLIQWDYKNIVKRKGILEKLIINIK